MKHYLITAIIMALSLVPSISKAQRFSAVNNDGVTLYYYVLSEEEKTCMTIPWDGDFADYCSGDIVIPEYANGYKVVEIGYATFLGNPITSVSIPKTVTTIGYMAFAGCEKLHSLTIPKTVKTIKKGNNPQADVLNYGYSFNKIGIEELTIEMTDIEPYAFANMSSLKKLTLGEDVKTIGKYAFYSCYSLESISFSNSVTSIGDYAFSLCSNLNSLSIPNSVTSIGDYAFGECTKLRSVSIPNSVTSIGEYPFFNNGITDLYIDMTEIGNYFDTQFSSPPIENLTLGEHVRIIGDNAFFGSPITSLTIPDGVTTIGDYAFSLGSMESLSIPNSVTSIGDYAFSDCGRLESVSFGNGVTTIGKGAFAYTGLTSISIPNSVTTIGEEAFAYIQRDVTITIPESVTAIGNKAFDVGGTLIVISYITDLFEIPEDVLIYTDTLYVPYGLADTYRATAGWNVVYNIVEMDPPSVPMQIACNAKGSVTINNKAEFTKGIGTTNIFENADNTITFTPKPNCRLDQVLLNGLDITANVEGNTLTCTIPANSQMIVTFTTEQGDLNNDGTINISDVVAIVNKILGN